MTDSTPTMTNSTTHPTPAASLPPAQSATATRVLTPGRRALLKFLRHRLAILGFVVISTMALLAIAAPLVAPHDPAKLDLVHTKQPPNAVHLLGTDAFGRDVLSRVIYGGRVSLLVGLIAVGIYETIAIVLGSIAGYYRGAADWIIGRLVDVVMTFPSLVVIIFMVAILGPSIFNCMLAIGLLGWTGPTRLVRGQFLQLREMDYITAARSIGVPDWRIILRHMLPGVLTPVVVNATFGIAAAILTEAALSFLGLGVQPPTASWGNMMSDAQSLDILQNMPWLWAPPGIAIMLAVLSINFVGDGLRDALDPKGMLRT